MEATITFILLGLIVGFCLGAVTTALILNGWEND